MPAPVVTSFTSTPRPRIHSYVGRVARTNVRTSSGSLTLPIVSSSFSKSSGESLMPLRSWTSVHETAKPPLQMAVEPPPTASFSSTTTLRPSCAQRAAAEAPAAPVPMMTTSASLSYEAGSNTGLACATPMPPAAAAMPILRKDLREDCVMLCLLEKTRHGPVRGSRDALSVGGHGSLYFCAALI